MPRPHASVGTEAEGIVLPGQSASPGRYEGRARVILDPSVDAELLPGEVLVAPYTDPAWTPLFLTAGAAVVEIGSYLSHAGTVAREFGMPCVVDVSEATQRIRSGDRIAVDGDAGSVRILAAVDGTPA
jgi:pyruvate,water dikinase